MASNGTENGAKGVGSNSMFPTSSNANDAQSFFATLLSSSPRRADALSLLSGPAAAHMRDQADPQVSALYLQAAARHIVPDAVAGTVADAGPRPDEAKQLHEILQAVGCAAATCSPRSAISQSGILPTLERLVVSPSVLNAAHVELLQCGLLAGQYRYIRRTLTNEWPRPLGGVSVQQVLRYYYYRGMIHIGCNEWQLAVRSFFTCVTIPSDVVSAITIAAWKKMVLCQCLLEPVAQNRPKTVSGEKPASFQVQSPSILSLPNAVSNPVSRLFTMASTSKKSGAELAGASSHDDQQHQSQYGIREYFDLVNAFCQGNREQYLNVKQRNAELWRADGNMGIVNRVDTDLEHRQVYQLARIYSVVPLSQLSQELHLSTEQVQALLLQISAKGMAVNVEADGMVSFPSNDIPEHNEMEHNLEEIMALADKIRQLDVALGTSPRYQLFARREKSEGTRSAAGPRGVAEL